MSKLVGYARVSTQDQDLKLQIDALLKSSKKLRLTTRFIIIYRPETVTFCWIAPAGPIITWRHINMFGLYDFRAETADNDPEFDVEKLLAFRAA